MAWEPLTEADQAAISHVVHQGYYMPDVFVAVAQIVRQHLCQHSWMYWDDGAYDHDSARCRHCGAWLDGKPRVWEYL